MNNVVDGIRGRQDVIGPWTHSSKFHECMLYFAIKANASTKTYFKINVNSQSGKLEKCKKNVLAANKWKYLLQHSFCQNKKERQNYKLTIVTSVFFTYFLACFDNELEEWTAFLDNIEYELCYLEDDQKQLLSSSPRLSHGRRRKSGKALVVVASSIHCKLSFSLWSTL